MSSYNDIKDFILTTDAGTSKNFATETFQYTSAAASVSENSFVQRNYTIPLSTETRVFEILVNMSDEDSSYYPVNRFERRELSGFGTKQWAMQLTASGDSATLVIYLVNVNISPSVNFAAFNVNVIRRDFVDEL